MAARVFGLFRRPELALAYGTGSAVASVGHRLASAAIGYKLTKICVAEYRGPQKTPLM
jgi:hypothetical protein